MKLIYRQHAIKRMHERRITEEEVEYALANGVVVENYPDDTPCPSALVLGHAGTKMVHVVYADDVAENTKIITLKNSVVRRLRRFPPIKQQAILYCLPTFWVMQRLSATL